MEIDLQFHKVVGIYILRMFVLKVYAIIDLILYKLGTMTWHRICIAIIEWVIVQHFYVMCLF